VIDTTRTVRTVYENLIRAMLVHIKAQKKIWRLMTESEQDTMLAQFDDDLRGAIRSAVDLVAADGMPHIKVKLEKVTFTDQVQGTISMENTDELRHRLADAARKTVILVVPDYDAHLQGERPRGEPEQTDLGLASAVEEGMENAAQQEREQAELADKANRKGCYVELLSLGFDFTDEEIAGWSAEQVTEARAWIAAAKRIEDESPLPDMPEFMRREPTGE